MSTDLTPQQRKKRLAPILLILTVMVATIGVLTSVFVYFLIQQFNLKSLIRRTDTIVQLLPTELVPGLSADLSDLENPDYVRLKGLLTNARKVNSDIRFAYLMGQKPDGSVFFYVDSEDPTSEDYSYPGQEYTSISPAMEEVFDSGQSKVEIAGDEYGTWLSGLAPVFGPDGRVIALLGLDTPALPYIALSAAAAAFPFLISMVLTLILLSIRRNLTREARILEDRQQFLSLAAHEIRTPVTGISWALEGMIRSKSQVFDLKTMETLSLMYATSNSLLQRINNLLSVTRIEAADRALVKEPVQIRPILADIVQSMEFASRKRGVTVVVDPSVSDALSIQADPQGVRHVFFNLISNAIKYAGEGTTVVIDYAGRQDKDLFTVSNNGEGMTAQEIEHIFDGYHRTDKSIRSGQEGTGLGLYLVKKTMELHGGSVTVDSNSEKTSFTVGFPKA